MGYLKSGFFLIMCFAVGVGIARAFLQWREQPGGGTRGGSFEHHFDQAIMTGVGSAPGHRGFVIKSVPAAGGEGAVAGNAAGGTKVNPPASPEGLMKSWTDAFATTVGIEYSGKEALVELAKTARGRGLSVALLPPAVFAKQNPYGKDLAEIGGEAQAAGVDILCISWLDSDPDPVYWRAQAKALRQVYKGKIILAGTQWILPGVRCWDAVDMIGVIGPVTVPRRLPHASDDISLDDLRTMWDCTISELESLARVQVKKIAWLRMDVPAAVWFKLPEIGHEKDPLPANEKIQRMMYESLLLETKGRAETSDVLLFDWGMPGDANAPNNLEGMMGKIGEAWDGRKIKTVKSGAGGA